MLPSSDLPLLVIVTGLSGAGSSTALHALADSGMYCIDNLPMELLGPTIALLESGRIVAPEGLAVCMDVRSASFARQFPTLKKQLAARLRLEVIFLTADTDVIATRFSTTRRRHPLLLAGEALQDAVGREIDLLGPVEEAADSVVDTSNWSPHQLVRNIEDRFHHALPARLMNVTVTSFGFKHGQLLSADTVFDVRFLENPYFVPELRPLSGLDQAVRDFILSFPAAQSMMTKIEDLLRFLLPLYYQEGKHYFRLGVGCTGGRHRSVCFAAELGQIFQAKPLVNTLVSVKHRDKDR